MFDVLLKVFIEFKSSTWEQNVTMREYGGAFLPNFNNGKISVTREESAEINNLARSPCTSATLPTRCSTLHAVIPSLDLRDAIWER